MRNVIGFNEENIELFSNDCKILLGRGSRFCDIFSLIVEERNLYVNEKPTTLFEQSE